MFRTTAALLLLVTAVTAPAFAQDRPIVVAPSIPGQPGQMPVAQPPGTAVLRGHVTAADTGQPLRKAQVRIFSPEIRENRMATTDTDGAYEFKDVRPGRY